MPTDELCFSADGIVPGRSACARLPAQFDLMARIAGLRSGNDGAPVHLCIATVLLSRGSAPRQGDHP
jgi:hypothetical protein